MMPPLDADHLLFACLQSTPTELLVNSPLGPFIVLSGISIWRDGLAAWNIPPCKEYLDVCQNIPSIQLFGN